MTVRRYLAAMMREKQKMPLSKIARNGHAAAVGMALAVLCIFCAPSMAQAPESNFSADVGTKKIDQPYFGAMRWR
jgi:hypothetical protein